MEAKTSKEDTLSVERKTSKIFLMFFIWACLGAILINFSLFF